MGDASKLRRVAVWVAAPLALAAAIAWYVGHAAKRSPALPPYSASWDGDREQRSQGASANDVMALSLYGNVEIVVRPSAPVTGPIEVRGAIVRGNDARPWSPRTQTSDDGAVRIGGPVHEVFNVPGGAWLAIVAVGRPGDVPSDPATIAAGPGAGAPWQSFQRQVAFRPPR